MMLEHSTDFHPLPDPKTRVLRIAATAFEELRTPFPIECLNEAVRQSSDYDSLRDALGALLSAPSSLLMGKTIPAALRMCAYLGFVDAVHPVRERIIPVSRTAIAARLKRLHGLSAHHKAVEFILDPQAYAAMSFSIKWVAQLGQLQEVLDNAHEYDDEDHALWQAHFYAHPH